MQNFQNQPNVTSQGPKSMLSRHFAIVIGFVKFIIGSLLIQLSMLLVTGAFIKYILQVPYAEAGMAGIGGLFIGFYLVRLYWAHIFPVQY